MKILASREDISDYLFHFTSGANAYDTLEQIIESFSVKDMKGKGYICFTETPITMMAKMFDFFESFPKPMYAPYGIAIPKDKFFELGGAPAIYGTKEDLSLIDSSLHWKFVEYTPNKYDFSWLREWRINAREVILDKECYVITRQTVELAKFAFDESDIKDVDFDGCVADGGYYGTATITYGRRLKGISLERIKEINNMSKEELSNVLASQSFDDLEGYSAGFDHNTFK